MTNLKKLNNLVRDVFHEQANVNELWIDNVDIQKQLKSILSSKIIDIKKKDPNLPKRGKSAYLFFCTENRDAVKKSLGEDSKATDVTRELGVRWNALKDSTKNSDKQKLKKYQDQANEDKERYQSQKDAYVPEETSDAPKRAKKTGPKRAKSAYLFFCAEFREQVNKENPSMKATEVTSELGRMWNVLKEDKSRKNEIEKYDKLAEEDKKRYQTEKDLSTESSVTVNKEKTPAKKTTKTNKKIEEDVDIEIVEEEKVVKTKKNTKKNTKSVPVSNDDLYNAFSSARRPELKKEFPKLKASEITKKISTEWKTMSEEDKFEWSNVGVVSN